MNGVTTAIVAFLFLGVIWPHVIKNKVQFYAGMIIVVFIILLDGFGHLGGAKVIYAINALLQVAAIVTLVLSAGMTIKDLGGEMINTIDVVRRGGEKETIIVPLRGEKPKPREDREVAAAAARIDLDRDIAAEEAALDAAERKAVASAPPESPVPPAPPKPPESNTPIPLE